MRAPLHRSAPSEHTRDIFTSSLKSRIMLRVGWVKNQTSFISSAGRTRARAGLARSGHGLRARGSFPRSSFPRSSRGRGGVEQSSPSALQSAERRALRRSGGTQPHAGRSLPPLPGTAAGRKGRGKEGREAPPGGRGEGANLALCPLTAAAAGSMGKAEAEEPARQAGRRGGSAARG